MREMKGNFPRSPLARWTRGAVTSIARSEVAITQPNLNARPLAGVLLDVVDMCRCHHSRAKNDGDASVIAVGLSYLLLAARLKQVVEVSGQLRL
jgi:hypothetical protein